MADGAVITFPPAIFEGDDLLVLALLDDFAAHARPANNGIAVGEIFAIGVQEHIRKVEFGARFTGEQIDVNRIAFRDPVLPAACLDNCVSHSLGKKSVKVPQVRVFDKRKSRRLVLPSIRGLAGRLIDLFRLNPHRVFIRLDSGAKIIGIHLGKLGAEKQDLR